MAFQNAKGNRGDTSGAVITPAPTRPAINDVVSEARKGGDGYGQNSGTGNPSSIPVGTQKQSALAANLRASVDDGGVLDHVIANGTSKQDEEITGQLRNVTGNVPVHPFMRDRSKEK